MADPMSKMILAIDDDENFLVTIKDMLEDEGYSVVTLSDPMKAEEYIEKYHPDLLIIDIFMPKRTGFNILEDFRAKKIHERVPKVFLTCLDDDIERMTARARGVEKYITKPFHPQEFVKKIKECLD